MKTYLSLLAVVVLTLSACGGPESGGTDQPAGSDGGSAEFCELGFRIGDTSTLQDVDLSSPAALEETYTSTIQTLADLVPLAPETAKATIEEAHTTMVEFGKELEAAGWDATQLSMEQQSRWINLGSELIDVSPAIREACA